MSGPLGANPENLAEIAAEITFIYESLDVTKYLGVAAATILIHDILSTLDEEIKYVWKSNWTFVRIAFHLNRLWITVLMGMYIPTLFMYGLSETVRLLVSHHDLPQDDSNTVASMSSCIGISLFYVWGSMVVMWIVTAMLMVRIWIIYGKGWPTVPGVSTPAYYRFGILASFLVITVPTMIIHVVSLMSTHWVPNPAPDLISACMFTPNKLPFLPYITGVLYETLLFLLTVFKTWRSSRSWMFTPLMTRLLKDGSCYYIVVLLFGLFSCLGALDPKLAGAAIGSGSLPVVMSCMCSRMILSTRSFYDDINTPPTSCELETLSRAEQQTSRESRYTSDLPSPCSWTPRKEWVAIGGEEACQSNQIERLGSPLRQGSALRLAGSGSRFKESWSMEIPIP